MLATVTKLRRHHVPVPRTELSAGAAVEADDDAIRHDWVSLLAAATCPAERDEINDVFGRAIR
jgi:hypothetical protein